MNENIRFGSYHKLVWDRQIAAMDIDAEALIAWVEDTLNPSMDLLKMKVSIRELIQDIYNYEEINGESKKSVVTKKKLESILDLCEKLDRIATQNCTFQLAVRSTHLKLASSNKKIAELEDKIIAFEKAWNELQ